MGLDAAGVIPDGNALEGEVAQGALHLAGQVRTEGEALQVRGEMADGLHGEDGRVHELALDPHPVDEILVLVVQRAQETEIAEVDVGVAVVEMDIVQQDLPVADLHLAGEVADLPAGLVRKGDVVRVAADHAVLHEQVGGMEVGLDFQVVPVDDVVGEGSVAPFPQAGGAHRVEHPERQVLDVHLAGFQQVTEILFRLVRVMGEAEDTGEVVRDGLSAGSGLENQVELRVL